VRRRAWGLSSRLIASYILVTLAVVVLVEALVLGSQVPRLVNGSQLQAQVGAAAQSYAQRLSQLYPGGVPAGTVLGQPGLPVQPGEAQTEPDGTLAVPAVTGAIPGDQPITAVGAIAADGTVVASSVPSRYPPGRAAASALPVPAAGAIATGTDKGRTLSEPYDGVIWTVWPTARADRTRPSPGAPGPIAYVYVQAPWSPGFINPVRAWSELSQLGGTSVLLTASAALIFAIVPVGVLFG